MRLANRALAFASRWFDEATVRGTFEPLIADWQREWHDAAPARRPWVSMRAWLAFAVATLLSAPRIIHTAAPASVTNRVATRVARFTLLASALQFVPMWRQLDPNWVSGPMVLFLLPGLIVIAFPFSMIGAVDTIRTQAQLSPQAERSTVLKLGLVAMVFMLIVHGWALPAGNQAWRVAMNPHPAVAPARGVRELTTWELIAHPERAPSRSHRNSPPDRADVVQRELNSRASMIVLPILLLWRRWSAWTVSPGRWSSPLPSWLATLSIVIVFLIFRFQDWFVEEILNLPSGAAAWLPLIIIMSAGMLRTQAHRAEAGA